MKNTPEFDALSTEAKVMIGSMWSIIAAAQVRFDRPHIIHPRARKGLDDLVEAGYLTVETLNKMDGSPWIWKPTDKLKAERPRVPIDFIETNSFPITQEDVP